MKSVLLFFPFGRGVVVSERLFLLTIYSPWATSEKRLGPTRHSGRRKEIVVAPNDCGKKGGAEKEREKKEEEECGRAFQRELGRGECSESRRR